ncbi:hypothetical protein COBT_001902 [Conglomerata obtusa]
MLLIAFTWGIRSLETTKKQAIWVKFKKNVKKAFGIGKIPKENKKDIEKYPCNSNNNTNPMISSEQKLQHKTSVKMRCKGFNTKQQQDQEALPIRYSLVSTIEDAKAVTTKLQKKEFKFANILADNQFSICQSSQYNDNDSEKIVPNSKIFTTEAQEFIEIIGNNSLYNFQDKNILDLKKNFENCLRQLKPKTSTKEFVTDGLNNNTYVNLRENSALFNYNDTIDNENPLIVEEENINNEKSDEDSNSCPFQQTVFVTKNSTANKNVNGIRSQNLLDSKNNNRNSNIYRKAGSLNLLDESYTLTTRI